MNEERLECAHPLHGQTLAHSLPSSPVREREREKGRERGRERERKRERERERERGRIVIFIF
jgi:hypothetical protein